MALADDLKRDFPWLEQMGLTANFFQELVASSASDAEIVTKVRQSSQYKQRFPGLLRSDGSMRMNESQYLQTEQQYRQVLNQGGFGDKYQQDNPSSLVGLFESEQDPTELKQRIDMYNQIDQAGQNTKDAFYVYAGMKVTTDDLFAATIDPAAAQNLSEEYNKRVASSPLDYETWITRATQVGLDRVSNTLTSLQKNGAVTANAVQAINRTDPNFARQMMDALYHGGNPGSGQYLNLDELVSSFEYAALGAAAKDAGLALPDKARIQEIRAAGIDRARASQAYSQYGASKGVYDEAVRRATGTGFDQKQFEDATFLGSSDAQARLTTGLARENAAGQTQGAARFGESETGRLQQRGLRGF